MSNAFATLTIQRTTINNRSALQGIIEVETTFGGWFAFSVFGFTRAQIKESAYSQADLNCAHKGLILQSLRVA